jgi:hypothetical protein
LLEKLVKNKLAIERGGGYLCHPLLAHFLVRKAQKEGRFETYAKAVQAIIAPRESWHTLYYRSCEHVFQDIWIVIYRACLIHYRGGTKTSVRISAEDLMELLHEVQE